MDAYFENVEIFKGVLTASNESMKDMLVLHDIRTMFLANVLWQKGERSIPAVSDVYIVLRVIGY